MNYVRVVKENRAGARVKKNFTKEDYHRLSTDLNNTHFISPLDSNNIKASIYYIKQKFIRYARNV